MHGGAGRIRAYLVIKNELDYSAARLYIIL
jgi:hypothetical protein